MRFHDVDLVHLIGQNFVQHTEHKGISFRQLVQIGEQLRRRQSPMAGNHAVGAGTTYGEGTALDMADGDLQHRVLSAMVDRQGDPDGGDLDIAHDAVAGDVQQICIEANRVDFDGIFAYNAADYLPRVSLTNKLLSDLYKYGEANISGDAIADSLHEMLSESSRHDGEVATDPELANLAATMAKMINGNLSANKKICDPAAGSGSLISSAMKVFNINGNQVVANDINPKLIELLSLRLGLNNPITINKSNAPVVTTKDILSFVLFLSFEYSMFDWAFAYRNHNS